MASGVPPPYSEADERNPFSDAIKAGKGKVVEMSKKTLNDSEQAFLQRVVIGLAMQWITVGCFVIILYYV